MKQITDPLGRDISVSVVVKGKYGWMIPLGYELDGCETYFARVPHGPIGVQLGSKDGVEVLVFLNGKRVREATLAGGNMHIIDTDDCGRPLQFLPEGEAPSAAPIESTPGDATTDGDNTADGEALFAQADVSDGVQTEPQSIPAGDGALFVVARFTEDSGPGLKPPRMEWPFTFALSAPEDHDRNLAGSLSRMIQPADPPNLNDLTSTQCDHDEATVPQLVCLTCGRH